MDRYSVIEDLKEWLVMREGRLHGVLIPATEVLDKIDELECEYA